VWESIAWTENKIHDKNAFSGLQNKQRLSSHQDEEKELELLEYI